jgi:hypothetical protein
MLLQINCNKHLEELTVEDICQLRDEFDQFMLEVATLVINKKQND